MLGRNKGHGLAWRFAQRFHYRLAIEALPGKEDRIRVRVEVCNVLAAAVEAARQSRYRSMHGFANGTMDPFTTKQQGKLAAPQALEAAIRVLGKNAQQCRRPFVPEEFSGCFIFQYGIHGFEFALLATDTCPFGPGAPPPDRRHRTKPETIILPAAKPGPREAHLGFRRLGDARNRWHVFESCLMFTALDNRGQRQRLKTEKPVLCGGNDVIQQGFRRAFVAHFHTEI